jgi:sugar phosphate isomerase/epimerase
MHYAPRRSFLKASACLGLGALATSNGWSFPRSAVPEAHESPIRLGVASYSFRKFGIPDVIEFMKELNTPYLNVKDMHLPMTSPAEVKRVADEYREAGIKLTAAGAIYFTKDSDAEIRSKFEYCKIAGIPVIVAGPTPQTLPRLEKLVKGYDIKIAIHNHGPEDKFFPSPLDALKAVKNMDSRMGVCVDVGHTARTGTDVPTAIRAAGPRLFDVHMKDLANTTSKESQVAVGDGSLAIEKIFGALIEIKYSGYVDLEYEIHEDDPMPGMIKSFAYMRGVLAGMGYSSG